MKMMNIKHTAKNSTTDVGGSGDPLFPVFPNKNRTLPKAM
jgi:hypothetical protein